MTDDMAARVAKLYTPPFRYDRQGQIVYDASGHRVLDIRGWGRIGYMDAPEALQDAAGEWVTELLTRHWRDCAKGETG